MNQQVIEPAAIQSLVIVYVRGSTMTGKLNRVMGDDNNTEHFLTANHSASDMLLFPIQKLYSARDSIRKAREAFPYNQS